MTSAQKRLLQVVGPHAAERGFWLAGGTAVALNFAHRESVDLDFFADDPISKPERIIAELEALVGEPMEA